jgi:hypothetical protein
VSSFFYILLYYLSRRERKHVARKLTETVALFFLIFLKQYRIKSRSTLAL